MNKKNLYFLLFSIVLLITACKSGNKVEQKETQKPISPEFNVDSAYVYIADQCKFGPRVMNSPAHDSCATYLAEKFKQYGATVINQDAEGTLYDGTKVRMRNIIASYGLDKDARIIICSHWDSRPWADQDPNAANHHTPIDGANDGARGVGMM